jgi:plastocyanin domain-containing protein
VRRKVSTIEEEGTMKYWKYSLLIMALSAVLFGSSTRAAEQEKRFVAKVDSDGVQKVDVLGGSYFFDPNYIVVKVNVPVELRIAKEPGLTPHNFILKAPEAGIDLIQELGKEPVVVKFTPTKPGKYAFHCDKKLLFFKSHKEKGMGGILEVTE